MYVPRIGLCALVVYLAAAGPVCIIGGGPPGPPEEAHVSGVTNTGWPMGAPLVASLGQMIERAYPSITSTDVVVRSGLATQAHWVPGSSGYLSPHPRLYSNAPAVDAAVLIGVGYSVAFARGGAGGQRYQRNADYSRSVGGGRVAAATYLKTAICSYNPVQVHLNFYHIWDEVALQESAWAAEPKSPRSHFVVVHGYDTNCVYFADNGPRSGPGQSSENVQVSWVNFLEAWRTAGDLPGMAKMGPYFACTLTGSPIAPVPTGPEWTFAYLGTDAADVPGDIRAAALVLRSGGDPHAVIPSPAFFADMRSYMASYADSVGALPIRDAYSASSGLWRTLVDSTDAMLAADTLDQIAVVEEEGIAAMQSYAAQVDAIVQLTPGDGLNLSYGFPATTIRWATMPGVTRPTVQFAPAGFASGSKPIVFAPRTGASAIAVNAAKWGKIIPKDDGDRTLVWRVAGRRGGSVALSDERTMVWDNPQLRITSPLDGYLLGPLERTELCWTGPSFTRVPRVVFATDPSFSPSSIIMRARGRRQDAPYLMHVYSPATLYSTCSARHLTTIYWRAEDADAGISKVQPSGSQTMSLPAPPAGSIAVGEQHAVWAGRSSLHRRDDDTLHEDLLRR